MATVAKGGPGPVQAFCGGLQSSLLPTTWSVPGHMAFSSGFLAPHHRKCLCVCPARSLQGRAGFLKVLCAAGLGKCTSCLESKPKGTPLLCGNGPGLPRCTWVIIPQRPHRSGCRGTIPGSGTRPHSHLSLTVILCWAINVTYNRNLCYILYEVLSQSLSLFLSLWPRITYLLSLSFGFLICEGRENPLKLSQCRKMGFLYMSTSKCVVTCGCLRILIGLNNFF